MKRFLASTLIVLLLSLFALSVLAVEPGYPPTNNAANIDQVGTNKSTITQTGSLNWGYVYINGNNIPGTGGDWKRGAYITEVGTDNIARIQWMFPISDSGAQIDILGSNNRAYQYLGSTHVKTTDYNRMGMDIDIAGNSNWALQETVKSFGSDGIHGIALRQYGDYNLMYQLSVGGYGSVVESFQTGTSNDFDVSTKSIAGMTSPVALPWAHKPVARIPGPNGAQPTNGEYGQYQNAMYARAHLSVAGEQNHTAQYQEYRVWSLSGRMKADGDIAGNYNYLAQGQLGEYISGVYDEVDADITGNENIVWQSQKGDADKAVASVTGNSNSAGQAQTGNAHLSSIVQNGNNNFATVVQGP